MRLAGGQEGATRARPPDPCSSGRRFLAPVRAGMVPPPVRISVIHQSLDPLGGGERVCLSLLRALDRTQHETRLRCLVPPPGVRFAGGGGGGGGDNDGAAPGAGADVRSEDFRRVRLDRVPRRAGPPHGHMRPDSAGEAADLFRGTDSDVAVVTDGGFVMERTDAPRVVWYCNSALEFETQVLSLPRPRHPRKMLRLWRDRRPIRRRIAAARDAKVVVVPNTESTKRAVSAALGRPVGGRVVYPPVDVGRFSALGGGMGGARERRTATVARFAPEKNLGAAVRIMREAGGRYDIVGNARGPLQLAELERVRQAASDRMRLHANVGQAVLEDVVGGARAYLQTSEETFGIAVVEAIAAGCVPVVPDNSAHPETVPFKELRYGTESEAVGIVRGALDGRYDHLLPGLRGHARRFSEGAFQEAMLGIVEGGGAAGAADAGGGASGRSATHRARI